MPTKKYYIGNIKKWKIKKLLLLYSLAFSISFLLFAIASIWYWQTESLKNLSDKLSNEANIVFSQLGADRRKNIENHLISTLSIIARIIDRVKGECHKKQSVEEKFTSLLTYSMLNENISAIQIFSSDNKKIFASWRENSKVQLGSEISVKIDLTQFNKVVIQSKSNHKFEFTTCIYYNPDIIDSSSRYFAKILLSRVNKYRDLVNSWLSSSSKFFLFAMTFTLLIALLLLLFMTNKLFIDPLLELLKTAEKIRKGNIDVQASENEVFELSALARCINSMSSSFADSIEGLKIAKQRAIGNEKYITTVLNSVRESVISLDSELKIQKLNSSAEELLNLSNEYAKGKNINDLVEAYSADGKSIVNNLLSLHDLSEVAEQSERKIQIEKNGVRLHISYTIAPIVNEDRLLLGAVIVMHDETEKFLQSKYLKETQKMETIGLLAGGVAHDFNNILQVIMTSCSILMKKAYSNQDCQMMLASISDATRRGKELVGQLLVFSRQKKATLKYHDLSQVIDGVLKMIKRIIGENIDITLTLPDEQCGVRIDAGQIEQVLMNLCMNAKDAMPQGGKLTISLMKKIFSESYKGFSTLVPKGAYVIISVKDNGVGISEEVLKNIFTPFFTTKEVGRGTGLGLATVYGVVEEHDGYVDVSSKIGCGTEFLIYLPFVEVTDENTKEGLESNQIDLETVVTPQQTATIMLAEDDSIVRMLTATSLREFGFDVVEVDNGVAAVNYFSENSSSISLVILDVIMPKMSGFGAFEIIREIKNDIPVIFASGYSSDRLKLEEKHIDNVEFLQKPYEIAEMYRVINKLLSKTSEIGD